MMAGLCKAEFCQCYSEILSSSHALIFWNRYLGVSIRCLSAPQHQEMEQVSYKAAHEKHMIYNTWFHFGSSDWAAGEEWSQPASIWVALSCQKVVAPPSQCWTVLTSCVQTCIARNAHDPYTASTAPYLKAQSLVACCSSLPSTLSPRPPNSR